MKNLFKPDILKIVIFVILILLTLLIPKKTGICSMAPDGIVCSDIETKGIGYPMFYGQEFIGDVGVVNLNLINFVINIMLYYLVACCILLAFNIVRSKR